MTYRLDSDFKWIYSKVIDLKLNNVVAPSKTVKWRDFEKAETVQIDQVKETEFNIKRFDIIWVGFEDSITFN